MKYSTKLGDAVLILVYLALSPADSLTSDKIAENVSVSPACVRQLMSSLRKGGIITSVKGHPRPDLAREPCCITLLQIYRAVEGEKPLFYQNTHINPADSRSIHLQAALQDCYRQIQQRTEEEMYRITLQTVLERYRARLERLHASAF